jgi:hypothetical protein
LPDTRDRLRVQGVETQIQSSNQFREKVRSEIERAGQPVRNRLVDQPGGDRRIDAAGQSADHPAGPDLAPANGRSP